MNNKNSYVESKDAPKGVPCRFCDMPGNVVRDGTAVDGERPLFSHPWCLINSGGEKQDGFDFSLQPKLVLTAGADEENIWAFASTYIRKTVEPIVRTQVVEEYADKDSGSTEPPGNGPSEPPSN